jgi:hypothetical protein
MMTTLLPMLALNMVTKISLVVLVVVVIAIIILKMRSS